MDAHVNFGYSTVATAPSPATSGVSLVVAAGQGARFPAAPFNAVVWQTGQQPTSANAEIVRVTAVSTDTLTITRAQESTSARTIVVGDQISAAITKKMITDIETDLASALSQIALQSAQIEVRRLADLGQYVCTGLALSANASTLTSVSTTIATSLFNKTAHGLVAGDTITFSGISTTTGVTNGTLYYVSATGLTANVFRVAATSGGTAITLGGTTDAAITVTQVGKLDMAAGTSFMATTELNASAQTAISTTTASLADATNPKWVVVELDSGNTVQFNQGTAASTPVFPTITTTRTPLGFLYVPANATNVDTLLTTSNGLAKLIDARNIRSVHLPRLLQADTSETVVTNPTSATSLLNSTLVIPANSLNVGDTIVLEAAGSFKLAANSTFTLQTLPVLTILGAYTTASLALDATNSRRWMYRLVLTVQAIGASAKFDCHTEIEVSSVAAGSPTISAERAVGGAPGATFNSAASLTIDLKATIGTGNASSTVTMRQFSATKIPAQ